MAAPSSGPQAPGPSPSPPPYYPPPYYPPPVYGPPPGYPQANFGSLFSGTFRVFGSAPLQFFLVYLLYSLLVGALSIALAYLFFGQYLVSGIGSPLAGFPGFQFTMPPGTIPTLGFLYATVGYGLSLGLLSILLASFVTAAMTYFAVQKQRGVPVTLEQSVGVGMNRFLSVLVAQILLGLLSFAAIFIPIILVLFGAFTLNFVALAFGILLLLAMIPILIFVYLSLALYPAAIVMEGLGPVQGLQRSWQLTPGRRLSLFGAFIVVGILGGIVSSLLTAPAGLTNNVVVILIAGAVATGIVGSWSMILVAVGYDLILKEKSMPRPAYPPPYPYPGYPYPGYMPPPQAPPPGYRPPGT